MQVLDINDSDSTPLREEVEKRYLAYALSTIVARALPDVRDGLKPVHRRILYAMHGMRLGDAARMRKSAAVVGEVIGKYHPHGDQAAYDAMVRMAQDFSLRYPLVEGSGNFGSVDGDAPAAMRYTETRLSGFAGLLLREIEQGTTEFRPTYDGMGEEPTILPAAVPNLLLNGSSGIAVGMSCSFPPHNLVEVIAACRAMIKDMNLDSKSLLKYVKGPDFPTGAEILDDQEHLAEIYTTGYGSVRLRGTFEVEKPSRGRPNIIVTSIPYSVNKSRLIERIALLIRDKKLKQVVDVRDESTADVRIVLEPAKTDIKPELVMAFLYKHTDLQINFPVNMIAITPMGVPDRLGLAQIIRYFLEFRYEKTVLRLQFRLTNLERRIHLLEAFALLFDDLDRALKIIRSASSRSQAAEELKAAFNFDDEQTDAILEMRLYKLVGLEIGKLLEELAEKKREAADIRKNLGSPERLWKIVDNELGQISDKFGDVRRTQIISERDAVALEYDPDEFIDHEETTVILSVQGWIRRQRADVSSDTVLKFRENDALCGYVRVRTDKTVAIFTNFGKLYVLRAIDVPLTTGFGEPLSSLFAIVDGECAVGIVAPETVSDAAESEEQDSLSEQNELQEQPGLFETSSENSENTIDGNGTELDRPQRGILLTKNGMGFRFEYSQLLEATKRMGRRFVNLKGSDEVVNVLPEDRELLAIGTNSGSILVFPIEQVPVLSGPAQGVRTIKLTPGTHVKNFAVIGSGDEIFVKTKRGLLKIYRAKDLFVANRDTKGKQLHSGISQIGRFESAEVDI